MVDKRVVAAIVVAAAVLTLIFSVESMEAAELMHEAADEFVSNFEFISPDGRFVEPSLDALRKAQEPYRTHFLIYSFLAWGSGATAICCLLYTAKDSMLEGVRRLSKGH